MRRLTLLAATLFSCLVPACAQWEIETSNTTADLRGIHSIGNGVAWASGTNGTILRTEDSGYVWQTCSVPPGAEKLDFRGIQGFDANTAIVMSSGKGDLSRLYKTTDGCHSWQLLFTNPDSEGFWDAVQFRDRKAGMVLGDPVRSKFALWVTADSGNTWDRATKGVGGLAIVRLASKEEGAFAASNSSLIFSPRLSVFVTGGPSGSRAFIWRRQESRGGGSILDLPLAKGSNSAGAFSIASSEGCCEVVVGGDYMKPDEQAGTAAYSNGGAWRAAQTPPHGYRSSVAYDTGAKTWVTVGPNGTDISTDDGKNWRPLRPDAGQQEAPDADRNWNAISLPFVVGPHGRIGKLISQALKP